MRREISTKVIALVCKNSDVTVQMIYPFNKNKYTDKTKERLLDCQYVYKGEKYISKSYYDKESLLFGEIELDNSGFEIYLLEESKCMMEHNSVSHVRVGISHPVLRNLYPGVKFMTCVRTSDLIDNITKYGVIDRKVMFKFCIDYSPVYTTLIVPEDDRDEDFVIDREIGKKLDTESRTSKWIPGNAYLVGGNTVYLCLGELDTILLNYRESSTTIKNIPYLFRDFITSADSSYYSNWYSIRRIDKKDMYLAINITIDYSEYLKDKTKICSELVVNNMTPPNIYSIPDLYIMSNVLGYNLGACTIDDKKDLQEIIRNYCLSKIESFPEVVDNLTIKDTCIMYLCGLGKNEILPGTVGYERIYKYYLLFLEARLMNESSLVENIMNYISKSGVDKVYDYVRNHSDLYFGVNIKIDNEDIKNILIKVGLKL